MKRVARLLWIARFDMEDLTSSLLRNGTLISLWLIVASLLAGRQKTGDDETQADQGPVAQEGARQILHVEPGDPEQSSDPLHGPPRSPCASISSPKTISTTRKIPRTTRF